MSKLTKFNAGVDATLQVLGQVQSFRSPGAKDAPPSKLAASIHVANLAVKGLKLIDQHRPRGGKLGQQRPSHSVPPGSPTPEGWHGGIEAETPTEHASPNAPEMTAPEAPADHAPNAALDPLTYLPRDNRSVDYKQHMQAGAQAFANASLAAGLGHAEQLDMSSTHENIKAYGFVNSRAVRDAFQNLGAAASPPPPQA